MRACSSEETVVRIIDCSNTVITDPCLNLSRTAFLPDRTSSCTGHIVVTRSSIQLSERRRFNVSDHFLKDLATHGNVFFSSLTFGAVLTVSKLSINYVRKKSTILK